MTESSNTSSAGDRKAAAWGAYTRAVDASDKARDLKRDADREIARLVEFAPGSKLLDAVVRHAVVLGDLWAEAIKAEDAAHAAYVAAKQEAQR